MGIDRFELPEQARKIRDREAAEIGRQVAALREAPPSTAEEMLSAVCRILNVRSRYMGAVGEHYSVQDLEGLLVVDVLDELLVRAVRNALKEWIDRLQRTPSTRSVASVAERFAPDLRQLPQYPVAFMILYLMRRSFDGFEEFLEESGGTETSELEHAFAHYLLGFTDRYVQSRERPAQRHFSDVEREYSIVGRLKCSCGETKHRVLSQSLQTTGTDECYDELDIQCDACGKKRAITVELPNYKDLYNL